MQGPKPQRAAGVLVALLSLCALANGRGAQLKGQLASAQVRAGAGGAPNPQRPSAVSAGVAGLVGGGKLDLNAATSADLQILPGIGPALATRIIAAREQRGGFKKLDELLQVRGIGPTRLHALSELLVLRSVPASRAGQLVTTRQANGD